jgi:Ca-activated chloride channel family protein
MVEVFSVKFLFPGWLYALLVLPIFYGLLLWDEKKQRDRFSAFIPPMLWERIVPDIQPRYREKRGRAFFLGLAFLFLALARPQFGSHEESVQATGLDLMVVLDVSSSMETEDVVPSRLKKAKHMIKTMLDRLGGDRVGVVAFAESSSLSCPLTTDLDYAWETVEMLDPRMVQSQGTDVGIGLETALRSLERGAEGSQNLPHPGESNTPTTQVVLLISDGEDHEGQAISVAKKFKAQGIRLYVLGVGTEKGGPIPQKDENGNSQGFKRDRSGQVVLSTFHSEFLSQVAEAAGGKYWTTTENESEISELLQDLGMLDRQSFRSFFFF